MRKIIYTTVLSLAVMAALASCGRELDALNVNPNNMEVGTVHPASLLPNILYSGCDGMVRQTYNLAGELIQHTASANTTDAYHRFQIPNAAGAGLWNQCARWAASADHMITLCKDDPGLCNFKAIALTMRAYYMQMLTDSFGDVPFNEAFRGMEGHVKPAFDRQKDVYRHLAEDLLEAGTLYDASTYPMSDSHRSKDRLYHGDLTKWKKFTNSLLLRVLMRASSCEDFGIDVPALMQEICSNPSKYPVFATIDDSAQYRFTGEDNDLNPYGASNPVSFNNGRRAAEFTVDYMAATGDPRISIYFVQVGGVWRGAKSGAPSRDEAGTSNAAMLNKDVLGDYNSPFSFMNYDEVLFIFAEAAYRGLISGGESAAEKYYTAAVEASVRHWSAMPGNSSPVSELAVSQFLAKVRYEGTMEQIMMQKYIALFWVSFEAWAEYRRTGWPALVILPTTMNDNILPRRLAYPVNTSSTNPDNYAEAVSFLRREYRGDDDMKTPVWWSKYRIENFRE